VVKEEDKIEVKEESKVELKVEDVKVEESIMIS
jgi:hypothetical protein